MEIGVVSLFPDLVRDALSHGIPGRALASGAARLHLADPRTFATDRHRPVDDRTAGGGPGMVLMA
ncbi:MAG: hypothetical protein MH204_12450, partial [Fimbriimonadaceae bacterium]|nr:hypothetical protein [Fimbriimonadaceae bacterium]